MTIYIQKLQVVEATQVTAKMLEEGKDDLGLKRASVGDVLVCGGSFGTPTLMSKEHFEANFEPLKEGPTSEQRLGELAGIVSDGFTSADERFTVLEKALDQLLSAKPEAKPEALPEPQSAPRARRS
jgi:hypothetical protein